MASNGVSLRGTTGNLTGWREQARVVRRERKLSQHSEKLIPFTEMMHGSFAKEFCLRTRF
jgi:hypothetical protein